MSGKKMVTRSVAVAVGLICIILVVSLVGVTAYYASALGGKESAIQTDDNQLTALTSKVENLSEIVNVDELDFLLDQNEVVPPKQSLNVYELTKANYSGFIVIQLWGYGVNISSTWINVVWGLRTSPLLYGFNVNYNETRIIPYFQYQPALEYFPVLQNGYFNVILGNNQTQTITVEVRVSYYY